MKKLMAISMLVAMVAVTSPAFSDLTVTSEADAFMYASAADTNYGTGTQLEMKNSGSPIRKSWIRFNISTWDSGTAVTSATLKLTTVYISGTTSSASFNVYALNNGTDFGSGRLSEDWSETGITWNNAPGNAAANGLDASYTTHVGSFSWSGGEPAAGTEFSVTLSDLAAINDSRNGDDIVTFIVLRTDTNNTNAFFASRENTNDPELTLTPEPATMTLLGLGGIGLLIRRRRRAQ
ncbi:MAG: DNRLRE domain-containing protein [Phycisphaerae bacterium]|nr:DNRLRE domain-containing protein [Phycisphaerae bacterium]